MFSVTTTIFCLVYPVLGHEI